MERDYEGHDGRPPLDRRPFETVNARLATRNDASIVGVTKGQSVSLLCVGRGSLLGAPQLSGCFVRYAAGARRLSAGGLVDYGWAWRAA